MTSDEEDVEDSATAGTEGTPDEKGRESTSDADTGSDDIPTTHTLGSLRIAQDEARSVLDHQIQNFNDTDTKAAKTFRLNAILLGLLLTAVSFIYRAEDITVDPYINRLTISSVCLFITSFIFAVISYTTTGINTGMGPPGIRRLIDQKYNEKEFLILLLRSEAEWMEQNERANKFGVAYLTIAHIALILGVLAAFVGIASVHISML